MSVIPGPLSFDPEPWERLMAETARRHRVPGMVAGVLRIDPRNGAEQRFAAGVGTSNLRTGVGTTRDTLCQIGSVTKLVTATMIMQLREEGRLALDARVVDLLPELEIPLHDLGNVTVEHLLTHTSGINGDVLVGTTRGDDCLERYLPVLRETAPLFPAGAGWSYCNSGFVLAGRIVEILDGRSWDASVRARIGERLGLERFFTLPEEVIGHRSQFGHVRVPGQSVWQPAPVSSIPRAMGPAGGITSGVDEMLDFGAAFLRGGRGPAGARLLSESSVALMTGSRVVLDPAAAAAAPRWGLGWMIDDWEGHRVVWHGGSTIGNTAWFHVLPDDGLAMAVFCNGGLAPAAASEVFGAFAEEFAGAVPHRDPEPQERPLPESAIRRVLGRYSDDTTLVEVSRTDAGGLEVRVQNLREPQNSVPGRQLLLQAGGADRFVVRADALSPWTQVSFTEVAGVECVYVGARCLLREDAAGLRRGSAAEGGAR